MHALHRLHVTHTAMLAAVAALVAVLIALILAPSLSNVGASSTGSARASSPSTGGVVARTATSGAETATPAVIPRALSQMVFKPIQLPFIAAKAPWASPWSATPEK